MQIDKTVSSKCDTRPKSVCEDMLVGNFLRENPPPVPPPPINYSACTTQVSGMICTNIFTTYFTEYIITLFKLYIKIYIYVLLYLL